MVHSEDFAVIALLSSLLLNIPRTSHACFVPTLCEETIVDYFGERREGGSKTQIILKFDKYSENLFQKKIILPRSSSGKGELSGVLNPACLATPCHRHWNPVYPFKDAGSWEGAFERKQRSFENCLAGSSPKELIQNWIASVEISNFDKLVNADEEPFHLTFLTISITQPVIDLDFSHCKFSAKQPTWAEPALLLRNKSAGLRPSERVSQHHESWHNGMDKGTDTNSN